MRDFNRNNRSGGGRDFRNRDSGRREMYKAVCDECGNNCEVPFKPSGDKPIYCSSCFENKEGGSSRRAGRKSSGRFGGGEKDKTNQQLVDQITLLNTKLDRILNVIESGVGEKRVVKKAVVKKVAKKASKKIVKKPATKK